MLFYFFAMLFVCTVHIFIPLNTYGIRFNVRLNTILIPDLSTSNFRYLDVDCFKNSYLAGLKLIFKLIAIIRLLRFSFVILEKQIE